MCAVVDIGSSASTAAATTLACGSVAIMADRRRDHRGMGQAREQHRAEDADVGIRAGRQLRQQRRHRAGHSRQRTDDGGPQRRVFTGEMGEEALRDRFAVRARPAR